MAVIRNAKTAPDGFDGVAYRKCEEGIRHCHESDSCVLLKKHRW
ncbi:MAG: hypothetical protein SVW57_10480 [Thermodesulfobacteriota bacterium]|nr:hypothetical protein [Thermodesulfobacteriota bacterium]